MGPLPRVSLRRPLLGPNKGGGFTMMLGPLIHPLEPLSSELFLETSE